MGAFDDLIPSDSGVSPGGGAFADLIPREKGKIPRGAFNDLIPEQPSMLKTVALNNPLTALGETGLNIASQVISMPAAGLAGLGTAAGTALGLTETDPAEVVHKVAGALTYQPRGELGRATTELAMSPLEAVAKGGEMAGDATLDATDSPNAAATVASVINALPLAISPALKAGKAKLAKMKGETPEESTAPAPGSTNDAPAIDEIGRPGENATGREAMQGGIDVTREQGAGRLAQPDRPLLQPGQPGMETLRGEGDTGLPAVDGQLPAVSRGRGTGTGPEAIDMAGAVGRDEGLRARQRGVDDATGAGEPASVLQNRDPLRQADDGGAGFEATRAAEQRDRGQARGAWDTARDAGESSAAAPDIAGVQRQTAVDRSSSAESWNHQEGGSVPATRGVGDRASGVRHEEVTAQPILDLNAGPLSRAATVAVQQERPAPVLASQVAPEAAGDIQASFAPGHSYTGFIDDALASPPTATPATATGRGAPIRREDILVPFAKDLGASIYTGRITQKKLMGFFRPGNEEVRIKRHADLETTAHEMAHLIDSRVPAISTAWRSDKALREQLKSVSYDQASVKEGFAEGVRLWMTQPEVLRERAPLVHDWLTNFAATDQRYGPAMRRAQEGMTRWFGQDAIDRARSKIGDHRQLSDAMDGIFDRFRQATVDDLHGVFRMERELEGGKLTPNGPYESARLSRASASIADGAVRFGYPVKNADGSFSYRGKGLQDILKPVADHLDDALLYFVGRSAAELMRQGREHLFTKGEIRGMLALETPEARRAFAEYGVWNRGVLDFAEAQGVLNPESRRMWKRTEYLPFHRVEQPGGLKGKPGDWAGIQALTGGTENIRDVLGNMIGNAAQLIDVAVKNEARVKIANLASRPGGGKFMTKIDPGKRQVKVSGSQVLDEMFKRYGLAVDGEAPAFFEFMLHNQPPAGSNVTAVLKSGKPVWYEVADPILYRALSAIDRPPMPWLTRWLGVPKRVGQASITLTPDFMIANVARDTIMGSIMSRSGFRPILDSINGMRLRITEDPLYRDYIANGGGLSSIYLDEGKLRHKLEKFYHDRGIDYRTVLDAPDKMLSFIETIGDAFETSTRLGEYKRAIEQGEHPRHAAYQGRDVSTDFAMRGDSKALGFLYDTVMFLRPAVVSLDRLYRGVAHDPNKAAIGAKTAMLALASVGLYLLNRQDARYQDLADWDRDANWHFFVGDQHFRYPKIWEIGALASVAERTVERVLDTDPMGLGKDLARIVSNTFSLNLMPQILAPAYEQATNRNPFTKAPIETPGMENVQPFLRAKPNTSETMKAIGFATRDLPESLQVPPARGEALLRGYLNTWAMYGLMLSDKAFFGDKLPESRSDRLPIVRRFYSEDPPEHTRFETQFYDMLGEAKRLQGTLRELDRMGRPEIADEKEKGPLAGEAKPLERAAKNLQGINADMLAVRRAPDLTPEEKRSRLDSLTVERNALLKDAVLAAKAAQATKQ